MNDTLEKCWQCGREFSDGEEFWYCPDCGIAACADCESWHDHEPHRPVSVRKVLSYPRCVGRVVVLLAKAARRVMRFGQ